MATFIRDIVFKQEPQIGHEPGTDNYIIETDMVVDVKLIYQTEMTDGGPDNYVEDEHRVIVSRGMSIKSHPFPKWLRGFLKCCGVDLSMPLSILLTALYEEGGLDAYTRDQIDRMYINQTLKPIKNPFKRGFLDVLMGLFIGSNLGWKWNSEETKVARIEPI